jgi:hypothetical protein
MAAEFSHKQSWKDEVTSMLIFGVGPIDSDENFDENYTAEELSELKVRIDAYSQDSRVEHEKDEALASSLKDMQLKLKQYNAITSDGAVLEMLKKYKLLHFKIQHLSLAKAMAQLKSYKTVSEIPTLIFNVCSDIPVVLLAHSKIKKVVVDTVNEIRAPLLRHFHTLFDEHLVAAQKESNGKGSNASGTSAKNALWTVFLMQAKDWLLAYSLVNLLPTVLTETHSMVLEKFQETLDEALTPIWGRYYYHLQVAREAKSPVQLIWTFEYTRSFVRMMCDLSAEMTSSAALQVLLTAVVQNV